MCMSEVYESEEDAWLAYIIYWLTYNIQNILEVD